MSGPATTWQVSLDLPLAELDAAEAVFGGAGAFAVSTFELEPGGAWSVMALFAERPPAAALSASLRQTLAAGMAPFQLTIEAVEDRDWVAQTERVFPPLEIGPFVVHGSHVAPPAGERIPILIDAGGAFGTGEHATTEGCLLALAALRDNGFVPESALDMGCGSGILAIAAAKLWPGCRVLAVDVDPAAVALAREAAAANGCAVEAVAGDGYDATAVAARAPFDLVTANILANPLVAMAPRLAACLAPGGMAILSGLLAEQAGAVAAAHEAAGLTLAREETLRGWSTLVVDRERG